ncbi:MAG: HAMP domain-containing histidine kinase [Clostridiales bacterium]|nr:HAMP domain-containing histidine kinase [Clostridiales bacterium]
MLYWAILATIIAIALFIALFHYRMQIRKNCHQLEVMQKHTSNQRLTSEIPYKEINELVLRINEICNRYQEERIAIEKNENNLKEAIANLSHDIRTPLTSLDGYVQLLVMTDSTEEKEHYLQIIKNRISSLKELLEELFTYTKMQDQNYELAMVPMDGRQCICETVLAFYEDFEKRGLTPDVNFCEEDLMIVANEVALRRVIQNLVKNALEHGQSRLGLSLEKKENYLHFSCFNDKKPGEIIEVDQIFDRFYKGDKARTSTSTGLGLAIAKGLVERMGGSITAEVKEDLFIIEILLPLSEKASSEKERNVSKDH